MRVSLLVPSLAATLVSMLLVGCGSSPSASAFDDPVDGGGAGADTSAASDSAATDSTTPGDDSTTVTESGTTDTGTATDASKPDAADPLTLDNVCDRLPGIVCTAKLAGCCSSKGETYDEGACRDAFKASCETRVDAVKAGDATFDPTAFAPCAAAWGALATKCAVPILEYVKTYAVCQQLFNGTVVPNDSCTADEDCHAAPGQWVRCSTDGSSRCNAFTVPAKDKACGYGTGTAAICDYGLACNYTSMTMGTCKMAKSIGASCNQDYECGFGNYCAKTPFGSGPGSCQAGLPYMSGCGSNNSCASGRCSGGTCTDPNVQLGVPAFCSGG